MRPRASCLLSINKQWKVTALNRQGTKQQRPELPTVILSGMQVNTGNINTTKDNNNNINNNNNTNNG